MYQTFPLLKHLGFLKLNALINESDKSLRFKLFLLPILPSGEIIPDNLINATTGVLEKNNILPLILIFNLNEIYKIVTKIIIIF